jgi:hypothetical protein
VLGVHSSRFGTEAANPLSREARTLISTILDDICNVLDCQIGNTVSLIVVPDNNIMSAAECSRSSAICVLHIFLSVVIGAESVEELGSLEMYCRVSRTPSPREFQLIERAVCLAAVGIKRFRETGRWQQLSHAWSSVRTRFCAGNADFDELTVKQKRMFDLETIEVPNRRSQSGKQIQARSITNSRHPSQGPKCRCDTQ